MSQSRTTSPAAGRVTAWTVVWTVIVPLVVLAAGLALAFSWRDELPDPVATHWGSSGVDGTGSFGGVVGLMVALVVVFSAAMAAVGLVAGRTAAVRRMAAFLGVWFAVVMCGLLVGSLAVQRGVADAHQVGGLGPVMAVAFSGATVLAAGAAAAVPRDERQPTREPVPAGLPRAALAGTAGARWSGTVAVRRPWLYAALGVLLVAGLGWLTRSWAAAAPVALVLAVVALMLRWTVTVDRAGLTARAALPWPRTTVPLDEVLGAEVVQVDPLREYGGWGYRVASGGRVGIVLRAGEAILVRRTGGRELVVTVDGAERAAALLNTLAERAR